MLLLLSAMLLPCACGPSQSATPDTVEDDLGRVVALDAVPERIVSLAPSNTEILYALGLEDRVVGVTDYCDYPPEAEQKPKVGGYSTPDIERIVALEPDLVLATDMHEQEIIPNLTARGLAVVALEPHDLQGILADIRLVGRVTGTDATAAQVTGEMQDRIDTVADKVASAGERPRVVYITWHDPLWSVGTGTIIHELMEQAGGHNIFHDATGHKAVSLEPIIARDPQVIVAGTGHGAAKESPLRWARQETRLAVVQARKNGRVHGIDADLMTRGGPRVVQALEKLASFFHPDAFDHPGESE
ncbi:MAG: ABC transporter substrate-binding protein [Chloroflexota bacterium]